MTKKIMPFTIQIEIDLRNRELKYFWELMQEEKNKKEDNWVQKVMEVLELAERFIVIHTPYIVHPNIIRVLEKKKDNGVRIYILVENIDFHKNYKFGIFRYKKPIRTTYILIDPKTKKKGLWLDSPLSTKDMPSIIVELKSKQVKELLCHFIYEFWKSKEEVFFGKKSHETQISDPVPEIPTHLSLTARKLDSSIFEELVEVSDIILPPVTNVSVEQYYYANKVGIPLSEDFKEVVELIRDDDEKEILASNSVSFGFISGKISNQNYRYYIFHEDIVIRLDDDQYNFDPWYGFNWVFHKSKKLGEIKGPIILFDDDWDKKNFRHIKDVELIELKDELSDILDWKKIYDNKEQYMLNRKEELSKKLSQNKLLARKVIYKIQVVPPCLPKGAKMHRLYRSWEEFEQKIKNGIKNWLETIDKYIDSVRTAKIKKKMRTEFISRANNFKEKLNKYYQTELTRLSKPEVEDILEQLINIEKELFELIDRSYEEISKKKQTEYEPFIGPDIEKSKRKESFIGLEAPYRTLPRIGKLYEFNNKNYLVIEYIDEIEQAKEESKKYGAKVVVSI